MDNAIEILKALLSGQPVYRPRTVLETEERLTIWCERDDVGNPYFFQRGWGSAYGHAQEKILEIIKHPEEWRIELQNPEVSDTTDEK
jgi:hypothetical protein